MIKLSSVAAVLCTLSSLAIFSNAAQATPRDARVATARSNLQQAPAGRYMRLDNDSKPDCFGRIGYIDGGEHRFDRLANGVDGRPCSMGR
jgi:hypothetical protein